MPREIVVDVFLTAAVLIAWASSIGVLVMRGAFDKLHYVAPLSVVAPVFIAAAVFVESGLSTNSAQTLLTLAFLVIAGPVLSHATIRAARIRSQGDWRTPRGPADGDDRE